ncbi:MAG: hypothetical protein OIN86_10570 [Candidatus Methanoperedens sp.]|nr:hypothetical protein [Candidatus Methanoperedens sp.]CAG1007099.1 hypothetical protein METP1_03410 [Methanosarcinales archaeon]
MSENYRKILEDLGIKKTLDEPLTNSELRKIFISMQEGLFVE